jgi:GNAT superfamily N-acetyltransferase
VKLSLMAPEHRAFVASTWARGSRYGLRTRDAFRLVNRLLDASPRIVVAANGMTVHAWACGVADALHYVYVPPELRGHGIARRLITELFGEYPDRIVVTHRWPRPSSRFTYAPERLLVLERAAA